jgi:chromosome segregation ATPase
MMANKDKELMMIKAAEYDKVDVLKKLAESEGQQHIYGLEVDRLKQVIYDAELKTKIKDKEISSLKDAINAKDQEKRHFNHQNQVNFDQFDTKFDSLHNQLQQSMQDNQQYKE